MPSKDRDRQAGIRYEPDEHPPPGFVAVQAAQRALLAMPGLMLITTVVMRAGGESESYVSWAVFASVAVYGAATMLQAIRFGRLGSGHLLGMAGSGAFIAVCTTAVAEGGPALLATLVLASALLQFALAARLQVIRRLLNPVIEGTVIVLIPVTCMPVVFGLLADVPDGSPAAAAPVTALLTAAVSFGVALKAQPALRLWAPLIGIASGSLGAGLFGIYDTDLVADAAWIGMPAAVWRGIDLGFGSAFWALLPAFAFVTVVVTIQGVSNAVAVQHVSWRKPRAVDYRVVQGAIVTNGVGNTLAAVAGTAPGNINPSSAPLIELTGVASRVVGIAAGGIIVVLAFVPKVTAMVLAIPGSVFAAYLTVLLSMLFVTGVKMITREGLDYRRGLIVGAAFWIGFGFQSGMIFPEHLTGVLGSFLQNGMTAGGLVAILMTLFLELTKPRRSRIELDFDLSVLPRIRAFLTAFVRRSGWDQAMARRLDAAAEETLLTLLEETGGETGRERRRLLLSAQEEDGGAVLEFVAATGEENLQDRIALLPEQSAADPVERAEREVSLRLLRHVASYVRHQQYHDTDIVTVRVDAPGGSRGEQP